MHFIDLKALCSDSDEVRGLEPTAFESLVKGQCEQARKILREE